MPRMWVRCLVGALLVMFVGCVYIYFTMFVHAPTEDILAANRKSAQSGFRGEAVMHRTVQAALENKFFHQHCCWEAFGLVMNG